MDRRKTDRRLNEFGEAEMLNLQDIMDILWRRKVLILAFMLLAIVPGMIYIITKPEMYEATAMVMMEEPDSNMADLSRAAAATGAGRVDEATFATQLSILTSPRLIQTTLQQVTKRKDINETEIKDFYENLTVSPVGKALVLTVSFKSEDAENATAVANAHVQNYIDYRLEAKKQQIEVINKWLNEQVAKLKEDSQTKGQAIQEFRGESGIVLGPDAQNLIYQQISELTQQLVPIETQKIILQSKVDALKGKAGAMPDVLESDVINDLKSQLTAANQELKAVSSQYGVNHPQRRAAQKRVSQIYGDIAQETKNISSSIETQLEAVTKQEELLTARIDELNKQADKMQTQSLTMESLQGELEANRKLLVAYMDKFQEIKTKMDLSNSDIRILNLAEVPVEPSGPGKALLSAILVFMSVFFGIAAALLFELIDRGIENENDVKRVLNLKLLGNLPKTKNPMSAVTGKTRTEYGEELKRIYISLAARKAPQTILVTSATNREGKTTVALSLAQYLASIKARVVIVDADSDSPSLATLAGTDVAPGFAELMSGSTDFSKAIKREGGLPVIPAGDRDRHNADILGSNAFPQMLETLKSQYDFVIIDSANALSSTDAEVIAGQVDNVIMVVQWNKTSKKILKKVAESLRQNARDIPSVILNKRT